jgi:hypothetical protein
MIELSAKITCPACGYSQIEQMPEDYCRIVYQCKQCGKILHPQKGDCCVFCSYADKQCPSKQQEFEKEQNQ